MLLPPLIAVPPLANSQMDGYAVRAQDTSGASRQQPKILTWIEKVFTGQMPSRTVGPGEMRAAAMEGGTRHELGAGDVLVVPPGVPHHFAAVSDPFLYLVAKVQD